MNIKAEVDIDAQHGPIVRVHVDDESVAVYLMDETSVVRLGNGKTYGLQVSGNWPVFKAALQALHP